MENLLFLDCHWLKRILLPLFCCSAFCARFDVVKATSMFKVARFDELSLGALPAYSVPGIYVPPRLLRPPRRCISNL